MPNQTFSYPVTIQEPALDTFGHVNNAMYLTLLEEARWDFITSNGYGLEKIRETGLGPTILQITISFLKELILHDKVIIETTLLSYQKKIGKISQKIIRDNVMCCEAELVIALFDLNQRKLVLPTKEWLAAIGYDS